MSVNRPIFSKKKGMHSLLKAFFILLFLALIGGGGYYFYENYYRQRGQKSPVRDAIDRGKDLALNPGVTFFGKNNDEKIILCLGLDESRDEKGIAHHKGSRTDTIFLVRVDKQGQKLGILSIPRDTHVMISKIDGWGKINSVYALAFLDEYKRTNNNYEAAGNTALGRVKSTLEKLLNIKIDKTVLIQLQAAQDIVDAIGGVDVDVEKNMDYDDNWGNLHIHLKKGKQKLKGADAIGYARFRHDEEGDLGRIRRQQQVLKAIVRQLKDPRNIMRINEISKVVKKNIHTNISVDEMIDLARVYKDFDKENVVRGVLKGEPVEVKGISVLDPYEYEKDNQRLVSRVLQTPEKMEAPDIRIRVLNGCGAFGLARNIAQKLQDEGYVIVDIGNTDEKNKVQKTRVIDHYLNQPGLEMIKESLDKQVMVAREKGKPSELNPDFTIILGEDFIEKEGKKPGADIPDLPDLEPDGGKSPEHRNDTPVVDDKLL